MKKTLLFLVIVTVFGSLQAQPKSLLSPVQWYSFEEALQMNAERAAYGLPTKKIFIDVYTDWCGWCKRMDATTFAHPVIADYLNTYFIPVKINAERKDTVVINGQPFVNETPTGRGTHQLAQVLLNGKMSYPSYALIDENGAPIQVIPGYQEAPVFEMLLQFFITDAYKATPWEAYQKTFKGLIPQSNAQPAGN